MTQFVDWDLAARTARALGKTGPAVTFEEAASIVADLRRLAEEAAVHVREFTGLEGQGSPVRVVDRPDWAQANIDGLRTILGPLADRLTGNGRPGPFGRAVGTRVTAVQAGTVLAYLSGKVLGQYEIFGEDSGQLLLIAPNILDTERKLNAEPHDFRLWVCLHEVTHRTQFTAVPWLRDHFIAEITAFAEAAEDDDVWQERARRAMSTIAEAARDPESRASVIDAVTTEAQRVVITRITALMTLLEGHAEYVMDGVGPDVISSVAEIRKSFNKRRTGGNPLERVVRKLLGVDVKLRQYAEGRAFVDAAVSQVGMATFNRVWTSPETLPTLDEIGDAEAWVRRVCD